MVLAHVILVLALIPASPVVVTIPHLDKLQHVFAFVVLWLVGTQARWQPPLALALGLLLFGIGIEVAQSFTSDRDPSTLDVLADAAGIALGTWMRPSAWGGRPTQAANHMNTAGRSEGKSGNTTPAG